MKRLLIFALVFAVLFNSGLSYDYWRNLTVNNTNSTMSLPENFTLNFTVDTQALISASKMQTDCGDLAIFWGAELRPRNVSKCNAVDTIVSFKSWQAIAPTRSDGNYSMRYGNATDNQQYNDTLVFGLGVDRHTIALLHFDEGTDNVTYSEGNITRWEAMGGNFDWNTSSAIWNKSITFHGSMGILNSSWTEGMNSTVFTVEGWVRWQSGNTIWFDTVGDNSKGWYADIWGAFQWYLRAPNSAWGTYICPADGWLHFMYTYNMSGLCPETIWINGNLHETRDTCGHLPSDQADHNQVIIGCYSPACSFSYLGSVDEIRWSSTIRTIAEAGFISAATEPTILVGVELPVSPAVINITKPLQDEEFLAYLVNLSFTFNATWNNTAVNVSVDYDDNVIVTNWLMNNTQNFSRIVNMSNYTHGNHSFKVLTNSTNKTVNFTMLFWNVTNTYNETVYESGNSTLAVRIVSVFPLRNATLVYNGSLFNSTNSSSNFSRLLRLPLLFNASAFNYSYWWNFTLNNVNGSVIEFNSSMYNQTVLVGVYTHTYVTIPAYYEHSTFQTRLSFTQASGTNASLGKAWIDYNNSVFNGSGLTSSPFYVNFTIRGMNDTEYNATEYFNLTASWRWNSTDFGWFERNETWNDTFTFYKIRVSNCSISGDPATIPSVAHYIFDEFTELRIKNMSFDVIMQAWNETWYRNYSWSFRQDDNATLCVPPGSVFTVNTTVLYWNASYPQRTKHLINAIINDKLQIVNSYFLNSTFASLMDIYVEDEYGLKVDNAFVVVQKFFPSKNSYVDVTTLKTDDDGHAATYLYKNDTFYRFIIYENNSIVKAYNPVQVTSSSLTLSTQTLTDSNYHLWRQIQYSCYYSNTTKIYHCDVSDGSGKMVGARLVITQDKFFGSDTYCDTSAVGSVVTLICDLSSELTNSTVGFQAKLYARAAYSPELWQYLSGEYVVFRQYAGIFGAEANFGLFLIVAAIALVGIWQPVALLVISVTTVVLLTMFGLMNFSNIALVGLAAAIGFVLWKIREDAV